MCPYQGYNAPGFKFNYQIPGLICTDPEGKRKGTAALPEHKLIHSCREIGSIKPLAQDMYELVTTRYPGMPPLSHLLTMQLHRFLPTRHVLGGMQIDQDGQDAEHQGRVADVKVCLALLQGRVVVAGKLD